MSRARSPFARSTNTQSLQTASYPYAVLLGLLHALHRDLYPRLYAYQAAWEE